VTTLLKMNFVPSIPAFSKTFNFPDESRITPAQAIRVNVNDEREIAVDAPTCLVNDSKMVGDLRQLKYTKVIPSVELVHILSAKA
jgi:hypothetical protein